MSDLLSGLERYVCDNSMTTDDFVVLDDVRETLRSDEARRKIAEALAANGVHPNEGTPHSWRCNEPDRYPGYCTCVPDLVDDIVAALTGGDDEQG